MSPFRFFDSTTMLAMAFALGAVTGGSAYETTRLGLFEAPEFRNNDGFSYSEVVGLTPSGWVWGISSKFQGSPTERGLTSRVANPLSGVNRRLFLPSSSDPLFTSTTEDSRIHSINESGVVAGQTAQQSDTGFGRMWMSAWVARLPNGPPRRVGLIDRTHTHAAGYQVSSLHSGPSPAGYCAGISMRFASDSPEPAWSTWIANPDGLTTRIGMPEEPEFTRIDGYANSRFNPDWEMMSPAAWPSVSGAQLTSTGLIRGHSRRFNNLSVHRGTAAWIASAVTGETVRMGLLDPSEFRGPFDTEESFVHFLTDNGLCAGISTRFQDQIMAGHAAWVGHFDGSAASTRRVGFHDVSEFSGPHGIRLSEPLYVSPSGWVAGLSERFAPDWSGRLTSAGWAAWVADAATGSTTRIGRFTSPDFPALDTSQSSGPSLFFDVGVVAGHSNLEDSGEIVGIAPWVAIVSTGRTTRIGLFGTPEFTTSRGGASSTLHLSMLGWETPLSRTPHPVLAGTSKRYPGSQVDLGNAAWLADGTTGQTFRIGLYEGPEFIDARGYQSSTVVLHTFAKHAAGTSAMVGTASGQAAWVAELGSASRRVGLYDPPEFVSSTGDQFSAVTLQTATGFYAGGSARFIGDRDGGTVAWMADLNRRTVRLGHADSTHTAMNGEMHNTITWLKESGIAAGYSHRHNGRPALTWDAATAWLYDLANNRRIDFTLSVRKSDGYAKSTIHSLAENGVALGSYMAFNEDSELGERAFVYVPEMGTFDLGDDEATGLADAGLAALASAHWLLHDDWLLGYGVPLRGGGQGIFATKLNLTPNVGINFQGGQSGEDFLFDLVWPASVGSVFAIESSNDLTSWRPLPDSFTASSEEMRVRVAAPFDAKAVFWRVRRTP